MEAGTGTRTLIVTTALALLLGGCSASRQVSYFKANQLAKLPDKAICLDYFLYRTDPDAWGQLSDYARRQLESKMLDQALIREELQAVQRGQIRVGMSECALLAAWGPPTRVERVEERSRHRSRYEYTASPSQPNRRVYLSNARVVGWE